MNTAAALAFARAHWRGLSVVALCIASFCAGRFTHRCPAPPAVHEVAESHAKDDVVQKVDQKVSEGPKRVVTYNFDPSAPVNFPEKTGTPSDLCRPVVVPGLGEVIAPPGERVESVTVEDDAPTVIDTHSQAEEHQQLDRKLDLTIAPAALAQWQAQVGLEDALHARTLRLAVRRRLFGPVWAELSGVPSQRSLGIGLGAEW